MTSQEKPENVLRMKMNENNTTYRNLQDAVKAMLKEKIIAINSYIKKKDFQ